MTNDNHPITPPPELVEQWREEAAHRQYGSTETDEHIAEQAARWGNCQGSLDTSNFTHSKNF